MKVKSETLGSCKPCAPPAQMEHLIVPLGRVVLLASLVTLKNHLGDNAT